MFNKKAIERMMLDIYTLNGKITELEKDNLKFKEEIKRPKCFGLYDGTVPTEDTIIHRLLTEVNALKDYLKVDIKWEWKDDPTCLPTEIPKIKAWKAYKRK